MGAWLSGGGAGQGARAVEWREDIADGVEALGALEDAATRAAGTAERALLAGLEAGCTAPVGALATVTHGDHGAELLLQAFAGSEDAAIALRRSATGSLEEPDRLGCDLAAVLLADGADKIAGLRSGGPSGAGSPIDHPDARGPDASLTASASLPNASRPDQTATERAL